MCRTFSQHPSYQCSSHSSHFSSHSSHCSSHSHSYHCSSHCSSHGFSLTNIFLLLISDYGSYAYGSQVLVCTLFGLVSLKLSLLYVFTYKTNKQPQISTVPNCKYYFHTTQNCNSFYVFLVNVKIKHIHIAKYNEVTSRTLSKNVATWWV